MGYVNLHQRIGAFLGTLLIALTVGLVATQTPANAAGSYYIIKLYGYDRCLDVRDVSTANGALLQTWSCIPGALNQKFYVNYKGAGTNYYQIIAQHSYKCVDVKDVSWSVGAAIQQWDCLGWNQYNQVWARNAPDFYNDGNAVVRWISFTEDLCLQPTDWSLGSNVIQHTCAINNKTQWEMILAPIQG